MLMFLLWQHNYEITIVRLCVGKPEKNKWSRLQCDVHWFSAQQRLRGCGLARSKEKCHDQAVFNGRLLARSRCANHWYSTRFVQDWNCKCGIRMIVKLIKSGFEPAHQMISRKNKSRIFLNFVKNQKLSRKKEKDTFFNSSKNVGNK